MLWLGSQDWYQIGRYGQTVLVASKSQKARWAPMSLGPQEDPEESQSGCGEGIDPDSGGWNGETEQKDLAKFSMAWRCPSPNCWIFHSHTVP